ncbi:MAG: dihydropteroate synthase [Gammaproteobacteria bacterium]|nr:dihydropteroate synthase [Gammaproteobacteria bacterium]
MHAKRNSNRPAIMGILNVTPDSFSDGGLYVDGEKAIAQALAMAAQGADIIDVGGESTRPGSARIAVSEQKRRVLTIIERLHRELPAQVRISIDTTLSEVAQAALRAGARIINDISAGREDAAMFALAREHGAELVLMHMQGTPENMHDDPSYTDVVAEVSAFLQARAQVAEAAGVPREKIILDPGVGFGKTREHNLCLIARLAEFAALDYQILLGTSRKRFMGSLLSVQPPAELVPATCATTALGVMAGVDIFRVHDVAANRQAADVAWGVRNATCD